MCIRDSHKSEHDEKIPENEAGNQEGGEDAGIPLGKETIEVERGRVQELVDGGMTKAEACLLYTSPSPRDRTRSRMPSSA